jgi:hypothetical protein
MSAHHEGIMGECEYSYTQCEPRNYVEVSGHLHALATQGKSPWYTPYNW